jgi:hypothetical protein
VHRDRKAPAQQRAEEVGHFAAIGERAQCCEKPTTTTLTFKNGIRGMSNILGAADAESDQISELLLFDG